MLSFRVKMDAKKIQNYKKKTQTIAKGTSAQNLKC